MNAVTPTFAKPAFRPLVRVVVAGQVNHGKSSLIERLLHETNNFSQGRRGQDIVRDTGHSLLCTRNRNFELIDAPGQAELLHDMFIDTARPDATILTVDAGDDVSDQSRRHVYILQLLGIRQIIVAFTKMDRIGYDAGRFFELETEIRDYLGGLDMSPSEVVPVSTREGVGITQHTYTSEWYRPTIIEALEKLASAQAVDLAPQRLAV
jgi:bifunctional enzyme CysN/CysC